MYKYKIGDKVVVTKPVNTEEYPSWTEYMNKYDGKTMVVRMVTRSPRYTRYELTSLEGKCSICDFNENWLSHYNDPLLEMKRNIRRAMDRIRNA